MGSFFYYRWKLPTSRPWVKYFITPTLKQELRKSRSLLCDTSLSSNLNFFYFFFYKVIALFDIFFRIDYSVRKSMQIKTIDSLYWAMQVLGASLGARKIWYINWQRLRFGDIFTHQICKFLRRMPLYIYDNCIINNVFYLSFYHLWIIPYLPCHGGEKVSPHKMPAA